MGGSGGGQHADAHFGASLIAAVIIFPLWRASAIAQSGFHIEGSNFLVRYWHAVMRPPHRGMLATIGGMAWARGAIFFGSDQGKKILEERGSHPVLSATLPPLLISTFVQVANMPLVRATITIQDPKSELPNVRSAIAHIYRTRGIPGLWHGLSAGILKTVPKYITAVVIKDAMEAKLPPADPTDRFGKTKRSAIKSIVAGVAGAALTNPLDVIRNEMFKTDLSMMTTIRQLLKANGWAFCYRGLASNLTAVSVPVATTIFLTDMIIFQRERNSVKARL